MTTKHLNLFSLLMCLLITCSCQADEDVNQSSINQEDLSSSIVNDYSMSVLGDTFFGTTALSVKKISATEVAFMVGKNAGYMAFTGYLEKAGQNLHIIIPEQRINDVIIKGQKINDGNISSMLKSNGNDLTILVEYSKDGLSETVAFFGKPKASHPALN